MDDCEQKVLQHWRGSPPSPGEELLMRAMCAAGVPAVEIVSWLARGRDISELGSIVKKAGLSADDALFARARELLDQGLGPQQAFDRARAELDVERAEAAKASISNTVEKLRRKNDAQSKAAPSSGLAPK
jgi:hypothetical protein